MSHYPKACFLTSAHLPEQFVPDQGAEVAFAGRSNAGKSTAINAIVNMRGFAHTSKSPGRTQLINFFRLRDDQRLVDLPGYGYARVPKPMQDHWRRLLDAYFGTRRSLAGLIVVVDIRRGLGDFDWQMVDWAERIGCRTHILLSKADKLKRGAATGVLHQVRKETEGARVTAQLFSAINRVGGDEARVVLDSILVDPREHLES